MRLVFLDTWRFIRAASQSRIKQSILSKHGLYLELRLALPLYRRSTRGVVPTEPGVRFLVIARQIIEDIDTLAGVSLYLATGEAGILRLGFVAH
ncbi:LysR family transcriptional regulator [Sphingomonas glacialis]|uniref:LysR family transcriptional regulator n=2 Tax=Sphingomonas glacialis TaxID=658225 RepID=A0A502FS66_9SPHN|nr:LysR family transcriptional regulator [Sphingomonas glacialis]